jgi:SPP1 gp7 family putative phage head morphogenesis protein
MLMAQGMPYEQAHNAANAVELAARQAAALKVDLRKWRRKAAADLKAGRKPRGFVSDLIGKGLRHWVSKCLEDAELAKAFKRPKRSEVRTYSTSSRAKPLIAAAAAWWQHKLEAYASHYVALAIAKLGKAKKQEGDDWEPPETTEAEWSELAAQLEAMYLAGAEDSADLVGAGQMSGVEYASRRGAELIGKRWDADAGAWIDNPSQKWVISDSVREQVAAKLEQAIEDGSTVAEFRTTMVDYFSDIPYRALMIARTETGFAYNAGALANYRDQEVAEVEVMDGGTEGSCEDCDALDGETWTVEQAEADPLEHPNCTRAFAPILGTE